MSIVNDLLKKIASSVEVEGERTRATIQAGLSETTNGLRLLGARYRTVYPNRVAWGGRSRLMGWSLREPTGGAPAQITIYDGHDENGEVLAVLNLAAGGASNHGMPGSGVSITEACYVAVAGAVQGALYLGAVD